MKKIVNPCKCEVYDGRKSKSNAFAEIEYEDGNLSIHGVIGPMGNGDCMGSAGQCVDEIRAGEPTEEWNNEMLQRFCDIWDRWHMNNFRPYCQHQKELGWDKLANKEVTLYHYQLKDEAIGKKDEAKSAALSALKRGETFTPTQQQTMFANLPYSMESYKQLSEEEARYYELSTSRFGTHRIRATETEKLRWVRPEKHPEGLLGKPCPVCGHKYGSSWVKEDVPKEVIDWLFDLPDTAIEPAWV